jgi:ABC-type glycerol-3-phosphate transport system substrate-binding protein
VTLQYAFWGDQNEINATNAYLNSYMEKHPTVKIDALNFGSNTDFNTKITTLRRATRSPDLGYFYEPNVLTWGMNGRFVHPH